MYQRSRTHALSVAQSTDQLARADCPSRSRAQRARVMDSYTTVSADRVHALFSEQKHARASVRPSRYLSTVNLPVCNYAPE